MNPLFSCAGVEKHIGDFGLENISFSLEPGYILGIIGRNGSGKTTLLRTLMGGYKADGLKTDVESDKDTDGDKTTGDIIINGISLFDDVSKYKEQFAFVLNERPFDPMLSAKGNGRLYGRYYETFDMDKYLRLLERFEIPEKQHTGDLSSGQQIKQQLAFAMSYDAKIYFLDEPTGNLDVKFRDEFYGYMREIVSDGTKSIIYASHLVEEMEEFADYILWLHAADNVGTIKYLGNMDDLKERYRMVEADDDIIRLIPEDIIVGGRKRENHREMLIRKDTGICPKEVMASCRYADLKEIMYYEDGEVTKQGGTSYDAK